MPTYEVERQEIHTQRVKVKAADRNAARKMAAFGYGKEIGPSERQSLLDNPRQIPNWKVAVCVSCEIVRVVEEASEEVAQEG